MRVAVTGGSGFGGGAVCRALGARGDEVLAYGRRRRVDTDRVGGAAYTSWDITEGATGFAGVDVVVHCAGTVTDWGPAAGFFRANAGGTRRGLGAFPGARFVPVRTARRCDPHRPAPSATQGQA